MDRIQIIDLGYYHPSNANWNYYIHLLIDKTGARLYKSNFGGDKRIKKDNFEIEYLNAGKGSGVLYKWSDVKDLLNIELYNGKNWGEGSL